MEKETDVRNCQIRVLLLNNLAFSSLSIPQPQTPPCESALTLLFEDSQQRVEALLQVHHHHYSSAIADTTSKYKAEQESDESAAKSELVIADPH